MFVCESWIVQIAEFLNLPADSVRQINLLKPNELTIFNQPVQDFPIHRMYEQLMADCRYPKLLKEAEEFNSRNSYKKRGVSCIPTKYGIAFGAKFLNQAGALVHVYQDGTVLLTHGGVEMGQGIHTKMIQVAAECLEIPIESIYFCETSTMTVPNTSPSAASSTTDLNGMAVLDACQQIKEHLAPLRSANPTLSFDQVKI